MKDSIRKLTLGKKSEFKTVEHDHEGEKVVFKQPSLGDRSKLVRKSMVNGELDPVQFQIWSVIYLTYDQDGNKVFDETDYDSLLAQPAGSFVDTFAEKATELLGNSKEESN